MSVINDKKIRIRQVKQQYIIDCTIKLIERVGIDGITMDRIAEQASYTKRTLYSYFNSKDEILLWIYTDDLAKRSEYQKSQIGIARTGIEKLNYWAISLFEYFNSNKYAVQIQNYMDYNFVDEKRIGKPVLKRYNQIDYKLKDRLKDIFKFGVEDGSFRKELDIDLTIDQFLYSFRAVLNQALSKKTTLKNLDPTDYIYHFLNLFIRSLN